MPLPVNADTFQARLIWRWSGAPRPASNNLYFFDSVGSQTPTNLFNALVGAVQTLMFTPVVAVAAITDVIVTPLDGVTAGQTFLTGGGADWQGAGGAQAILQGACVVSSKTLTRGPRGRGRIYLPWIGESQQTDGEIASATIGTMQTAWGEFYDDMFAVGWIPTLPDPDGPTSNGVAQYVVRPYLKTQRRRALR